MKPYSTLLFLGVVVTVVSCSTAGLPRLGKQNLHEQYGRKLEEAGLKETALGQLWFGAAASALQAPQTIALPYRQTGYFANDKPRAVGLRFSPPRGAKLLFRLDTKSLHAFTLYTDLWRSSPGKEPKLVFSLDSTGGDFAHEVEDEGETYTLRLQPELLSSGEYTLSISVGPSLVFPVAGHSGRVSSVWGDARDAGARSHEGIDIFAPRGTPVVAAADGVIASVGDNNLGGKVIFLRPRDKNLSLYYAHLDEQLVTSGQKVSAGDTIGRVGNSGNARSTQPHLHFGIYAMGGAIDPFVFVNSTVKRATELPLQAGKLNRYYRTTKEVRTDTGKLDRNTVLLVTDVGTGSVVAQLPTGRTAFLPIKASQITDNQINKIILKDTLALLEAPLATAPEKRKLLPGMPVRVHGYYNEFALVSVETLELGWVARAELR
jgi:peptidoglycan LD-endopeptidase LytH